MEHSHDFPDRAITLDDAINSLLDVVSRDRALAGLVVRRMRQSGLWEALGLPDQPVRTSLPTIPRSSEVTLFQGSIWDNGPQKNKRGKSRYTMTLELWTAPSDEIKIIGRKANFAYKRHVVLYQRAGLAERLRDLSKTNRTYPVAPAYLARLKEMAAKGSEIDDPSIYIGLLDAKIDGNDRTFEAGTIYHDEAFVIVRIENGRAKAAILSLPDGSIEFGRFDHLDPNGNPLSDKLIGQSRTDLGNYCRGNWATNPPLVHAA